jgi:sugar/nucleoside kinase (ribokinase family)
MANIESDLPDIDLACFDILLLDGFQMPFALSVAAQARELAIPVVLDGGSWKEGLESLLEFVDIAICSADFSVPGSEAKGEPREVLDYLAARDVRYGAITRGDKAIIYYNGEQYGEIAVEAVAAVDTLGAGDIFHGAFCFYFAQGTDFATALHEAALVAGKSCQFFGTRAWMKIGAGN